MFNVRWRLSISLIAHEEQQRIPSLYTFSTSTICNLNISEHEWPNLLFDLKLKEVPMASHLINRERVKFSCPRVEFIGCPTILYQTLCLCIFSIPNM